MYTRLAALAAAAILMTTPAFAVAFPPAVQNGDQCRQMIDGANQTVAAQSEMDDLARALVGQLVAQLQDQCTASNFDEAERTANMIRGLVAVE